MRIEKKKNKTKVIITDQLMFIEHDDLGFMFEVYTPNRIMPYLPMFEDI